MWKLGYHHEEYQLRFFVLEGLGEVNRTTKLTYYTDETLKHKKGQIDLSDIVALEMDEKPIGSRQEDHGLGYGLTLVTKNDGRRWQLMCSVKATRDEIWAPQLSVIIGVPYERPQKTTQETQRLGASKLWREATMLQQPLFVNVRVPRWERKVEDLKDDSYTAFEVHVETNASFLFNGHTQFSIYRRYKEFIRLAEALAPYLETGQKAPREPPRKIVGRFSGAVIEERRQAFDGMMQFWMGGGTHQIHLPLYEFLRAPDAYHSVTVADELEEVYVVKEAIDIQGLEFKKLPPLLRFEDSSVPYLHRRETLCNWLDTRTKEELKKSLTCAFAAKLVESVGGLAASQRVEVADMLWPKVSDPQRMFLMLETIPKARVHELVKKINASS